MYLKTCFFCTSCFRIIETHSKIIVGYIYFCFSKKIHFYFHYLCLFILVLFETLLIKPGPTQQVDLRPGWLGGWTSSSKVKDRNKKKPSETRLTRDSGDPAKPSWDPIFFFKCVFSPSRRPFFFIYFLVGY